ncbi:MAG: Holliday junction resolvase RuvX [Planctomycetes bacterium]|nr:Holliday junction resolvase RuvX [Planctomycetota bacterium]
MIRVLGIDWGVKRHGLAVSDPLGLAAHPVGVVERRGPDDGLPEVARIAREKGAERVVVGLPFHMDGRPGDHHAEVLAFVKRLREFLGLPVETIDERLTTVQAERALAEGGLSRKKRAARVDQTAACFILRSWLDARALREKLPPAGGSAVD